MGMIYCYGCGKEIHSDALSCPNCGAPRKGAASGGAVSRRTTAALFAILLGGLGVHKFYLNQIGLGIVYLVFCWTFVPAFIGLIEGILYLTMSDEDFSAKYS